jgi:hypothetical protein
MTTDALDNAAAGELLGFHHDTVKIEEVARRKVVRFSVAPFMQGHTFAVEPSNSASESMPMGPFRIEYVLGTEFIFPEDALPAFHFADGYSYLVMAPELVRLAVSLQYGPSHSPGVLKDVTLTVDGSDTLVQRLIIETPEVDLSSAMAHTGQIVADVLASVSVAQRVPISIRHIEVHALGKKYERRFVTLP